MGFIQKMKFMSLSLAAIFSDQEINEKELEELKDKDVLTELIEDLGKTMPSIKKVLIDLEYNTSRLCLKVYICG